MKHRKIVQSNIWRLKKEKLKRDYQVAGKEAIEALVFAVAHAPENGIKIDKYDYMFPIKITKRQLTFRFNAAYSYNNTTVGLRSFDVQVMDKTEASR